MACPRVDESIRLTHSSNAATGLCPSSVRSNLVAERFAECTLPPILESEVISMSLENMLAQLPAEEKLTAMDILWRDLSTNPARLQTPVWHGDVLDYRVANPSEAPSLPIDAARRDVEERMNERRTQG